MESCFNLGHIPQLRTFGSKPEVGTAATAVFKVTIPKYKLPTSGPSAKRARDVRTTVPSAQKPNTIQIPDIETLHTKTLRAMVRGFGACALVLQRFGRITTGIWESQKSRGTGRLLPGHHKKDSHSIETAI